MQQCHKLLELRNLIKLKYWVTIFASKVTFLIFLFAVHANGNCLYNSCSLLLNAEKDLCYLLRGLVTTELLVHWKYYTKHPYILQKNIYKNKGEGYLFGMTLSNEATQQLNTSLKYKVLTQAKLNSVNRNFSLLLYILALSEVLWRKIRIFYSKTENLNEYFMYNGTIISSEAGPQKVPICLILTTTHP